MFPPDSPLVERTRILNEHKLAVARYQNAPASFQPDTSLVAAALRLPGKLLVAAAHRLNFRHAPVERIERQTTKPCLEQLEA